MYIFISKKYLSTIKNLSCKNLPSVHPAVFSHKFSKVRAKYVFLKVV